MSETGHIFYRSGGFPGSTETFRVAVETEFVESQYDHSALMPIHSHDFPFLHVVLQGRVTNLAERVTEDAGIAHVAFFPANVPHETMWHGGGKGFAVLFSPIKAFAWEKWGMLPQQPITLPPGLVSALLVAARRECFANDLAGITGAESYLAEALAELVRLPLPVAAKEQRSRRLWKAREMILDTYETLPTLDDIAHYVELHPVYLARAFRHAFGETIGDCIRRRRIEAGCRLIVGTELSLTEIAYEVGFADQSHFTRTFKQCLGVPPIEYAHAVRQKKRKESRG